MFAASLDHVCCDQTMRGWPPAQDLTGVVWRTRLERGSLPWTPNSSSDLCCLLSPLTVPILCFSSSLDQLELSHSHSLERRGQRFISYGSGNTLKLSPTLKQTCYWLVTFLHHWNILGSSLCGGHFSSFITIQDALSFGLIILLLEVCDSETLKDMYLCKKVIYSIISSSK